jgi:hypothetical protein
MERPDSSSNRSDESSVVIGRALDGSPAADATPQPSARLGAPMQVVRHPDRTGDFGRQETATEPQAPGSRPDIDAAIVEAIRRAMISNRRSPGA